MVLLGVGAYPVSYTHLDVYKRQALQERHYDLIFLDIVMKDRSGIELGRFIREELGSDTSMIVYMSAYGDEYALDLFKFQPFHFLKKPIRPEDFQNIVYKACEKIEGCLLYTSRCV